MTPSSTYHVRHQYRYEYSAPVHDVRQKLIMIPPDRHRDQVLDWFELEVRGTSGRLEVDWETDLFGNRLCRVAAERVEAALEFEAWFTVGRQVRTAACTPFDARTMSAFTALTQPDARIEAAAQEIADGTQNVRDRVRLAHEWTASAIQYRLGVTGTHTPAALALHLGEGVCQDYAHILLSVLRSLGVAARYVSGHLPGDGAPHAWVEAFVRDTDSGPMSVIGCDPTHRRETGPEYITVATGRDFADVTSTSGVFTGSATGRLHWRKRAVKVSAAIDSAA